MDDRRVVMQVNGCYLPPGENWIYDQMSRVERHKLVVAARSLANLKMFPHKPIYSIDQLPRPMRLAERAMHQVRGRGFFFSTVAKRTNAGIIHAHGGRTGAFIARTATKLELPLVVSFYGADMWSHKSGATGLRRLYRTLSRSAARLVVEGPAAADRLVDLGFPRDRIRIQRLGVDVENIPYVERSLGDGSQLHVLMASRLMKKKGLEYGVEGFARVAKHFPFMRLTIIGKRPLERDDRIATELMSIAKHHGVERQIDILGFTTLQDLLEIASSHQLFMQPSVTTRTGDSEGGHPVTLTLLAAHGMPTIGTRHCDIPQIVHDGETGWLVDERDPDGIAAALADAVSNAAKLAQRGRSARDLVERIYDLKKSSLDSIYDEL